MLVNSLYNIVDSFFVAQISENAMTALSLVYPVQNFINAVGIGFGVGINAVIAYYLGAGDEKKASAAASHGTLLSVIHGVILTAVCIGIMPSLFETVYIFRGSGQHGDPLFHSGLLPFFSGYYAEFVL